MDDSTGTVAIAELASKSGLPEVEVVAQWFDEDRGDDAERVRSERSDAYSVYMKDSGTKGPL